MAVASLASRTPETQMVRCPRNRGNFTAIGSVGTTYSVNPNKKCRGRGSAICIQQFVSGASTGMPLRLAMRRTRPSGRPAGEPPSGQSELSDTGLLSEVKPTLSSWSGRERPMAPRSTLPPR
jgi:hypothetical protein